MNKVRSIRQNTPLDVLPDFRNLGVTLRIILICTGLALLLALLLADGWDDTPQHMMLITSLLAPVMFAVILLLWMLQPWLHLIEYRYGVLAVNLLAATVTLAVYYAGGNLYSPLGWSSFDALRYTLVSVLICSVILMYFRLRSQALSRAWHDARLQVLRARIRPHFMFNSINVVLGIMRSRPDQAETALQDMADLFRMAVAETQDMVRMQQEINLSRQYIALEQLRMGERLRVNWQIHDGLDNAMIPPLLLQPLLENAVYHGIERLPQGGEITVDLNSDGNEIRIMVENPCLPSGAVHGGSKMALQNIRERLDLLFDVEARYKVESAPEYYRVEIVLPYKE